MRTQTDQIRYINNISHIFMMFDVARSKRSSTNLGRLIDHPFIQIVPKNSLSFYEFPHTLALHIIIHLRMKLSCFC